MNDSSYPLSMRGATSASLPYTRIDATTVSTKLLFLCDLWCEGFTCFDKGGHGYINDGDEGFCAACQHDQLIFLK